MIELLHVFCEEVSVGLFTDYDPPDSRKTSCLNGPSHFASIHPPNRAWSDLWTASLCNSSWTKQQSIRKYCKCSHHSTSSIQREVGRHFDISFINAEPKSLKGVLLTTKNAFLKCHKSELLVSLQSLGLLLSNKT